ncbi:MAG: NAD(+) synthase, partial [Acutalibacteraceae bacterium]
FNINNEYCVSAEICEDLWTPLPPSTYQAMAGAELIVNLSASNETIGKRRYREGLIFQQSARNICGYVYVSAGADESTTDLIFSGCTLFAENGTMLKRNENLIDSGYVISCDFDIQKLRADRLKNKSFKDCASVFGNNEPCRKIFVNNRNLGTRSNGELYKIEKLPFVPASKKDRLERCRDIFQMQVSGLKKRMKTTGGKPVIGISGGLDSTLALLVCAEAAKQLKKPCGDVIGITMPGFGTTDRTHSNSQELMQTLGVRNEEISIKDACTQHFRDIGHDINRYDLTFENSQARERTQILMDYAGMNGGFVVGTGDLSELALGWCTYNADQMSMYGVNSSIPKTLVRWMIDSLIEYNVFPKSTPVLRDILDTPISPELLPPDEKGKISQKTEDLIGPYALHDFYLFYVMRYGFEPEKIYVLAKMAFKNDFDDATIKKWLVSFYRRFFSQQFKRSCMPDGVKVGSISLSPRGD